MRRRGRKTRAPGRGGRAWRYFARCSRMCSTILRQKNIRVLRPGAVIQTLRAEKGLCLIKKSLPAGVARQNDVIATFQGHETRSGNTGRQPAALLERLHGVVAAVKHERRRLNTRKQVRDVD